MPFRVYIGFDNREPAAAKVLEHSIRSRTRADVEIIFLEHRNLRSQGVFVRPWQIEGQTGNFVDQIDGKPFSTEFSHSRFLVPALSNYEGWALFLDCDMVFQTDIAKLIAMCDPQYAVMCVKHNQMVKGSEVKMDNRANESYQKKNWSSFVLFNCAHPANHDLTVEAVNSRTGAWLHQFAWLKGAEYLIGALPKSYNYISGQSPLLPVREIDVIHYTYGGPWFEQCQDVPLAGVWVDEHENWNRDSDHGKMSPFPTVRYDRRL